MSANDDNEIPGIRTELDWIPDVLATGTAYLGLCLGAQLLARVLGATVRSHSEGIAEIGYYPLYPTTEGNALFPSAMNVYHWHTEGFEMPSGSQLLATGETFQNQAFRYDGNVYGLQFHPEVTRDILLDWLESGADRLALPGAQQSDRQLHAYREHHEPLGHWFDRFLDHWLSL
jgi:GMP synthase (glutamine-hydrolysing)